MDYFQIILEYLKVILWPILVFWAIFYFRGNIANFIDRIYRLKFPGGELNAAQQQVKQLESKENNNDNEKIAEKSVPKQLVDTIVANLSKEYEKDKQDQTNLLLKEIATRNIIIDFERIYHVIFGSQIALLEYMQTCISDGLPKTNIDSFWNTIKNYNPIFTNWTLDNYLHFLFQAALIQVIPTGNYKITDKGSAFLTYINNMKYVKNKGL